MGNEQHSPKDAYSRAGVDTHAVDEALKGIGRMVRGTFGYHDRSRVLLDLGLFANVLEIGPGPCIAVSTDSTGTKVLIAEMVGRHDTIGIDCVAMNVNDVLCVGAEPVCVLDYIAIDRADPPVLEALVQGVCKGAELSECSVPGGEIAQVGDILRGEGDGPHYDLVGTAVGVVDKDRVITGKGIRQGDVVIGIGSSGIHSNGLSLARKVCFEAQGLRADSHVKELGRTLGEELLEPTAIYVREVKTMLREGLAVRGLANITGGGLTNLLRLQCPDIGFVLEQLLEPQPLFRFIQEAGDVPAEEMYHVFNMGIGLCLVVAEESADRALEICGAEGKPAAVLGRAVKDPERRLRLTGPGLVGSTEGFRSEMAGS